MKWRSLFLHQWLLVAAVFFVSGFFTDVVDIAVHDTYFIISGMHIGIAGALLFVALWALHRIKAFRTIKWLSAVHLTGTSLCGIILLLLLNIDLITDAPKRYVDYSVYEEFNSCSGICMGTEDWLSLAACVFVFLQTAWFVQLIVSFVKRR